MGDYEEGNKREQMRKNIRDEEEGESPFPIRESNYDPKMKNINSSILLVFYGIPIEDLNTLSFEFEVMCRNCY